MIVEVLGISQSGYRGKDDRFIMTLVFPIEKTVFFRPADISKGYRGLLQDLLPVGHEQDPLVILRVKCRQIGLSDTGGRLHQTLHSTLCPGIFQCAQGFDLRPPGLKQHTDLCIRIRLFLTLIIAVQILCRCRSVPVFGVPPQLLIIYPD